MTKRKDSKNQPLKVKISKGVLSISVGVDTFVFAAEINPHGLPLKVTDKKEFLADVLRELNRESEDGTTPVHRLFDNAVSEAIDQGSLGVEEVDISERDDRFR